MTSKQLKVIEKIIKKQKELLDEKDVLITDLKTRATRLETDNIDLKTRVTNLETDNNDLKDRVGELEK